MRSGGRIATVVTATTLVALLGGFASVVAAPAEAPTAPASGASTGATSGATTSGPATRRTPTTAAELRVGTTELDGGLGLPAGVTLLGPAHSETSATGIRRWEVDLDLGAVEPGDVLDSLAADLIAAGFDVRRGTHDVFGARQSEGRWSIVVARSEIRGRGDDARDVLTLGIGSRRA